jgi:hypothetical protein
MSISKRKEMIAREMTDQLIKVVNGHVHDLGDVYGWQGESQDIETILPPIMSVIGNYSVSRSQLRVKRAAVFKEFFVKLMFGDIACMQTRKCAEDAAEEVGHRWVNIQNHTYGDVWEYKGLEDELVIT